MLCCLERQVSPRMTQRIRSCIDTQTSLDYIQATTASFTRVRSMSVPYYHLVGHILAASHAEGSGVALLKKVGFDSDKLKAGSDLAHKAEKLVESYFDEHGEDRIVAHEVHVAAGEIEMWMQTVDFLLSKELDNAQVKIALGTDLHGDTHLTTVIAQALRLIAMMRTDADVIEAVGGERKVRDISTRGWALLKRLYRSTKTRLDGAETALSGHHEKMTAWVASLDSATSRVGDSDLSDLGRVGYVPDGKGVPLGGTAYGVVLHERGQGAVPDPKDKKPCSGWSIGRQGNREHLGKGWS